MCAGVGISFFILPTEADKATLDAFDSFSRRVSTSEIFHQDSRWELNLVPWTEALEEDASAREPKCAGDDFHPKHFGRRVYCYFEGNPHGSMSCEDCNGQWDRASAPHQQKIITKLCGGNNYVQYTATDFALKHAQESCPSCTHLLVTNGDNQYSGDFLAETLARQSKITGVDFWNEDTGKLVEFEVVKSRADLGAVLLDMDHIVRNNITFLGSVAEYTRLWAVPCDRDVHPGKVDLSGPYMKGAYHDADFWFLRTAGHYLPVRGPSRSAVKVPLLLFNHQ
eukprot:g2444.t1